MHSAYQAAAPQTLSLRWPNLGRSGAAPVVERGRSAFPFDLSLDDAERAAGRVAA
jgi:hypothetical protein